MKKKETIEYVKKNFEKVAGVLDAGMVSGVCDEDILYANGVITQKERIAIKEENQDACERVMIGLRYAFIQVATERKSKA